MALLSSEFSIQFLISFLTFLKKKNQKFQFPFSTAFLSNKAEPHFLNTQTAKQHFQFQGVLCLVRIHRKIEKFPESLIPYFSSENEISIQNETGFQKLLSFPKAKYRKLCKCHFGVLFRWETSICFFQNPHPHKKKGV